MRLTFQLSLSYFIMHAYGLMLLVNCAINIRSLIEHSHASRGVNEPSRNSRLGLGSKMRPDPSWPFFSPHKGSRLLPVAAFKTKAACLLPLKGSWQLIFFLSGLRATWAGSG